MSGQPFIVRTVSVPGRHPVVIDARTSEIVWQGRADQTETDAWAEAERLRADERKHRHDWRITRKVRNTDHPLIRQCDCGQIERFHRGRWAITKPGRNRLDSPA
jgi:hypothetical protein